MECVCVCVRWVANFVCESARGSNSYASVNVWVLIFMCLCMRIQRRNVYVHVSVCVQIRGAYGMFGDSHAYIDKGRCVYMCELENIWVRYKCI